MRGRTGKESGARRRRERLEKNEERNERRDKRGWSGIDAVGEAEVGGGLRGGRRGGSGKEGAAALRTRAPPRGSCSKARHLGAGLQLAPRRELKGSGDGLRAEGKSPLLAPGCRWEVGAPGRGAQLRGGAARSSCAAPAVFCLVNKKPCLCITSPQSQTAIGFSSYVNPLFTPDLRFIPRLTRFSTC